MTDPLLGLDGLTVTYSTPNGDLTAVSNVSFEIQEGDYLGLVGESGCGKTTLIKSILGGLDDNGQIASGTVSYKGREIQDYPESRYNRELRWKEISVIPQSSMNSLDPLRKLSNQARELAELHSDLSEQEALDRFAEAFEIVGLPEERIHEYPHQFSGGMQQRVVIALAIFLEPSLIIADEPTTALDVIMQDEVMKYLDQAVEETNVTILLITHDISVVFENCNKIGVMHGGQLAEFGGITDVYDNPRHPYSILLQQAFPDIRHLDKELIHIEGQPPAALDDLDYCSFAGRCPWEVEECTMAEPPLEPVSDSSADPDEADTHRAACYRQDEDLKTELERELASGGVRQ